MGGGDVDAAAFLQAGVTGLGEDFCADVGGKGGEEVGGDGVGDVFGWGD